MKNFFNYAKNRFLYSLLKIIVLLLLGFVASNFISFNRVLADSFLYYDYEAQLYDNYGPSLHSVSTSSSTGGWSGTIPSMTANTSGAAWGISSPLPILANHTYSVSLVINGSYGGNLVLSTYNRIGVGTSLANAVSSYENSTNSTLVYSRVVGDTIQFAFTSKINATFLILPFATNYSGNNQNFVSGNLFINDLGSSGVSESEINSSLNNQTNEINNSITNSENNIKDSINSTEGNLKDSITNSENNIKDGIKEGFENCRDSYNLLNNVASSKTENGVEFIVNEDKSVTIKGTATVNTFLRLNHNIVLSKGTYYLSGGSDGTGTHIQLNTSDGYYANTASGFKKMIFTQDVTILYVEVRVASGWSGEYTFYPMISKENTSTYEKYGEKICSNRIDDTNNKLDEAENTRKSIWQTIKDLPGAFLNMLKSLIIPDNFDFIYDFKDSLENKLGFIASVPMQFINYLLSLPNKVFTPITSISFPEIEVFGTKFWNGQDVDITEGLSWFNGIKYFGDILCVILMVNTLNKWWKRFGGGNE